MERIDLYTSKRVRTGRTVFRGEPRPEGCYFLVVHICIFGSDGRMLIQKRKETKASWPGFWDVSCGGCVSAGEDSQTAGERELFEELGITVGLQERRPAISTTYPNGFDDIYVIKRDVAPEEIRLQAEEVEAVRWASQEEIFSMIDDDSFIPYRKELIALLFSYQHGFGNFDPEKAAKYGK